MKVKTLINSFVSNAYVQLKINGRATLSADIVYCNELIKQGDKRFECSVKELEILKPTACLVINAE